MVYSYVFWIVFGLVLYWTFPWDSIKTLMVTEFEARTGTNVQIDKFEPIRMSGLQFEGVRISRAEEPDVTLADIDMVRMRTHLGSLLTGRLIVDYDLEAYGGGLSGVFESREYTKHALAVNFRDLDLNKYRFAALVGDYASFNLYGNLSGHVNLFVNDKDKKQNKGEVNLSFANLRMTDAVVVSKSLPPVVFEPGAINMAFDRKGFDISEWVMNGDNLSVNVAGDLALREPFERSRLNFTAKFRPSETMLDAVPELTLAAEPDDEGWFNVRLRGTVEKPSTSF